MKTTQAVRNIRKYKRKIETAPKGRIVTDDYGNKLSVKKKPDGTFGRRHTLSQGKKRAIALGGDSVSEGLTRHTNAIKKHAIYRKGEKGIPKFAVEARHARSAVRRSNLNDIRTRGDKDSFNAVKSDYHSNRATLNSNIHKNQATAKSHELHYGTKRKAKDFTK